MTDTGIQFDAKRRRDASGTDQIFKIDGRKVTVHQGRLAELAKRNHLGRRQRALCLAPFSGNAVQTWKEGDKATATLATGPGAVRRHRGLADGRMLVTSWTDSTVTSSRTA